MKVRKQKVTVEQEGKDTYIYEYAKLYFSSIVYFLQYPNSYTITFKIVIE